MKHDYIFKTYFLPVSLSKLNFIQKTYEIHELKTATLAQNQPK
jgi:hypothetical protein